MMNKWWWLLVIFLCWMTAGFVIFGSGQNQISNDAPPPSEVNRIVSLAPNLTEILFALGLKQEIVGVTLYSNYPPAALNKPKVGTFWQLNVEAVIAAKPDLVLTLGFEQQSRLAEQLKRIGYNCLTLNIEKVNELFEAIEKIGVVAGKKHQANELTDNIRRNLDGLSALVGSRKKVRVLWVVQREPLRVAGRETFVNEMIELAGGENAIKPTMAGMNRNLVFGPKKIFLMNPIIQIQTAFVLCDAVQNRISILKLCAPIPSKLCVNFKIGF